MTFDTEEYFELLAKSTEKQLYNNAIKSIPISKPGAEYVVLTPSFKSFNHKATVALYWFFAIFVFGTVMFIASLSDTHLKIKSDKTSTSSKDS